ncbi:Glycosyl transferase family 2 [Halomicrobium sp. LC1Hm]|nr:Glycosyl transferase family 2 [Halomicrobium sp. LC1Hm]
MRSVVVALVYETRGTADEASPETATVQRDEPELSVVVVTYNEAARIADCLDAVFAACRGVASFEVLVVDSNSTDGTVAIADDYDATVLRIPDDALTTPGAGRYVGTQWARGDAVLFVDGDVVLTQGDWLAEARETLASDPSVAGVDGHLNERRTEEPTSVDYLHGVALYDREALAEVGGFHPFLTAWEDVDLGFQLTLAGYDLCRLPTVVGTHPVPESSLDQFRRWRQGYYRAGGQVCRKALSRPALRWRWLWYFRDKIATTAWLGLGALLAVAQPLLAGGWLLATIAAAGLVCQRLGVDGGLRRAISAILFPLGFALGFEAVPDRDAFPLDAVETIRCGSVCDPEASPRPSPTD